MLQTVNAIDSAARCIESAPHKEGAVEVCKIMQAVFHTPYLCIVLSAARRDPTKSITVYKSLRGRGSVFKPHGSLSIDLQ